MFVSTGRIILAPSTSLQAHAFFNVARQLLARGASVELLLFDMHPRLLLEWCHHEGIPWNRVPLEHSQRKPRLTASQRAEIVTELRGAFEGLLQKGKADAFVFGRLEGPLFEVGSEIANREHMRVVYVGASLDSDHATGARRWCPDISLFCHGSERELHQSRVESRPTEHAQQHIVTGSALYDVSFATSNHIRGMRGGGSRVPKVLLCLEPPEHELAAASVRQVAVLQHLISQLLSLRGYEILVSVPHGRGGLEIMRLLKQRFGAGVLISNDANTVGLLRWADLIVTADSAVGALAKGLGKSAYILSHLKGRFADFQAGETAFARWLSDPRPLTLPEGAHVETDGNAAVRCAEAIISVCRGGVEERGSGGNRAAAHVGVTTEGSSFRKRPRVTILSKRHLVGNFAEPLDHTYRTREAQILASSKGDEVLLNAVRTALEHEDEVVFLATPAMRPETIRSHVQLHVEKPDTKIVGLTPITFAKGVRPNAFIKALEASGRLGVLHNPIHPESRAISWGVSFSRYAIATLRRWPLEVVMASEYAPLAILRREGFELRLVQDSGAAIAQVIALTEYTDRLHARGRRLATVLTSSIDPLFCLALSGYRDFDDVARGELRAALRESEMKHSRAFEVLSKAETELQWTRERLSELCEAVAVVECVSFTSGVLAPFDG